ncbi:MAG: hypothetical protein R3B90_00700 [Planctomycetaceae bacterium]
MRIARVHQLIVALSAFALIGCSGGDSGPPLFNLSGTVTFDGQPLQNGAVFFEPTEGNTGPTGMATVTDGKFDTSLEGNKGHIGGKMMVKVKAYPAPTASEEEVAGPVPFNEWAEAMELPAEDSTRDIAVPKEAANPPKPRRQNDA